MSEPISKRMAGIHYEVRLKDNNRAVVVYEGAGEVYRVVSLNGVVRDRAQEGDCLIREDRIATWFTV